MQLQLTKVPAGVLGSPHLVVSLLTSTVFHSVLEGPSPCEPH